MERIRVTVADNRRNGVPSLLLVDDCVPQLLNADLPIMELMTNGRTMWLTVISLWQTQVRSGMVGNVIRSNATVVVFFKSMIVSTVKKEEWIAHDDSRHTEMAMQTELRGHTAGVILPTKNPSLYKMQAPETYPVVKIGRPDLKGKLVDLSADNDTAQVSAQYQPRPTSFVCLTQRTAFCSAGITDTTSTTSQSNDTNLQVASRVYSRVARRGGGLSLHCVRAYYAIR